MATQSCCLSLIFARSEPRQRSEWAVNQHRDSLALYVGYDSLAQFISIAENEAVGRVKFNSLQARRPA